MQDFCFHIHTPRCGHADPNVKDDTVAKYFYEAGFKTIAFTDHAPWKTLLDNIPKHAMKWDEKEGYLESVRSLALQYKGRMNILTGFESEYMPQYPEEMQELRNSVQIMIVGQHFTCDCNGEIIRMHKKDYVPNDFEEDYYANCLVEACRTHFADIIAHPDLFMLHKTEFGKKEEEISHRICQAAEQYKVPLEINLCQPSANMFFDGRSIVYPCREFWNIAKDYNIKALFGLDYHGHFHPVHHEEIVERTCQIIGEDIISKLHICMASPDLT